MSRTSGAPELGYVCVHGHFYQPPRENPWIEEIEFDLSAKPFHDWNQRIQDECYRPNRAARLLSPDGCIRRVFNNYEAMSFNFGPTLLAWMERFDPETYAAILAADRSGGGGPGRAMAQAYNHAILPLCNLRDKRTQILWGIADFRHRFGRAPDGLWLPETAVDLESLEILADAGVRFTVLAPHQAEAVRGPGDAEFRPVDEADPGRAYRVHLSSGRELSAFFYDGPASQAVAFERLLDDGARLADHLLEPLRRHPGEGRLSHIATDGETYGHHHRFGEMALAFALERLRHDPAVRLVSYAEYLEQQPPTWQVRVRENTSWSCAHGVERWRRHCGCATGAHPGWRQDWREPLRAALEYLRDWAAPRFETEASCWLRDPWAARDDYIRVVLQPEPEVRRAFLETHAHRDPGAAARRRVWRLLELQRHAMLMFTSCGWFFDDVSGIETRQVLSYAARVVELAEALFDEKPDPAFYRLLGEARSNQKRRGSARSILRSVIRRQRVDGPALAANAAAGRTLAPVLFRDFPLSHDLRVRSTGPSTRSAGVEGADKVRRCEVVGVSRRTEEPLRAEVLVRAFGAVSPGPGAARLAVLGLLPPEVEVAVANHPGGAPSEDGEGCAAADARTYRTQDLLEEVRWRTAWSCTRRVRRRIYRSGAACLRPYGVSAELFLRRTKRLDDSSWFAPMVHQACEARCYELLRRRPPAWDDLVKWLPTLSPARILQEPSPLLDALEAAALLVLRSLFEKPEDEAAWRKAAAFLEVSQPLLRPSAWWNLQNKFIQWAVSHPEGTPAKPAVAPARALGVCWPFPSAKEGAS